MPTTTTTYGLQKPTVGGDSDVWGGYINTNFDTLDDVLDGTSPITPATGNDIEIRGTNSATNAVTTLLTLNSQSSGTPANGIGTGLAFAAETAAGNTEIGVVLEAVTTDVTSASEDFDLVIKTMAAGAAAAERLRVSSATTTITGALSVGGNVNITSGGLQRGGTDAYALRSITYLTSGTAATYTTPSNCRALRVTCVGGGGGGGGVDGQGAGTAGSGGGGGAGAVCVKFITSPSATYTYTVGAGGAAGVGTGLVDGGAGGNTTFAGGAINLSAGGGDGGITELGSSGASNYSSFGSGGTATGGDLNIRGQDGTRGRNTGADIALVGQGGSGPYGTAVSTASAVADQSGASATGYGAGGSGAVSVGTTTNYNGGTGSQGLIIVEEFF